MVGAALYSPKDVLVLTSSKNVESLGKSGQLLRVSLLTSLAQIVLIMCHKLFDLFLS